MSVSRPSSARPRQDHDEHMAVPPSDDELRAIELHRIDWARVQGATVEESPEAGGLLVTHDALGSSLNYVSGIRWAESDVDARLEAVVELMSDRGAWPSIIVCDGLTTPFDLDARLEAAHWVPVFGDRNMWTRHPA